MSQGPIDPLVYRRLFEQDADGAAVLEELARIFARPPTVTGGIDAILKTYADAGARRVLEFIVAKINQANGVNDVQE